ncbi:MAG: YdjY domain-containing protein [Planctomycetota bacterium]|nr:YdjY domain-containing protein [Planctomycetota bacterium]
MRKSWHLAGTATAWVILAAGMARGAETPAQQAPPTEKPVVLKTLPGITVDTAKSEVRLEGKVCLQEGALELVVCSEGTREHESIVVVKARPSHVTFALALLGLEPGQPAHWTEARAFSPPAGETLDITARFFTVSDEEKARVDKLIAEGAKPEKIQVRKTLLKEVPAYKLLRLSGSAAEVTRPIEWVYVGRPEKNMLVAADREGTVVCLSNFVEAVIDVPFESTAVNADLLYEANPNVVPPVGTPVELVIRPTGHRIEPKKVEIAVVVRKGETPTLDGRPVTLKELKDAVNAMPASVRAAALKADPQETFGRVMQVKEVLEDALMQVELIVLEPAATGQPPPAKE